MGLEIQFRIKCDKCGTVHRQHQGLVGETAQEARRFALKDGWKEHRPSGAPRSTRWWKHYCRLCVSERREAIKANS